MVESGYRWEINSKGIIFDVARIRREKHELIGELSVRCNIPGARVVDDNILSVADFNFSSVRSRQDRARLLASRANTNGDLDWYGFIEALSQKVIAAEREGDPSVDLRTLPKPQRENDHYIEGLCLPRLHPAILFGDGGSCKSYVSLFVAGQLFRSGLTVALFDWELCGEDHRDRLERLFPDLMPEIHYVRCERPLTSENDRLSRLVRDKHVDYAIYDSIAFACDGRPEDAEIAGRYFRAVRQVGCGSLHIAHVNKSEDHDKKPFGSTFWANGARSTWFIQASDPDGLSSTRTLGFFNRKSNLGPLRQPVSWSIDFTTDTTEIRKAQITDTPEFAAKLSVRTRMMYCLKHGAKSSDEIAMEIEADLETVRRTIRRYRNDFIVVDGGKVGLLERHA